MRPRLAIVIPHCGGIDILRACLGSLRQSGLPHRVLLVDNASPDESVAMVRAEFPEVELLCQDRNLGFAGGCNAGLKACLEDSGLEFALLLNNDTEPAAGWLKPLVEMMDSQPGLAAVQPCLLSIPYPGKLDYSGAAGGLLDAYAFPFALGRVLGEIEDEGTHLEPRQIAWASGTACLFRLSALRESGLLEESFFMHMEEIELDWRLRLLGWNLASVPASRVYHHSGYSLGAEKPLKVFLNHRNSLRMLVRCAGSGTLIRRLPFRLLLDLLATLSYLAKGRLDHALAALKALFSWLGWLPHDLKARKRIQSGRRVTETELQAMHFQGSIALKVALGGIKRVEELGWLPPLLEKERNRAHV